VSGPAVLFAGGGTGGHLLPGVAAAERLLALEPRARVYFATTGRDDAGPWGSAAIAAERVAVASPRLPRGPLQAARFATGFASSVAGSFRAFRSRGIDGVVALGGYGCVGPSLAALASGRPVVALEANAIPGAAVRLLARLGAAAAVSFAETAEGLPPGRTFHTGNPLRASVLERRRDPARFGLDGGRPILGVVGGSLGAGALNAAVAAALPSLAAAGVQLIWVTGREDAPAMEARAREAGVRAAVLPYCDAMGTLYGTADLLLSRSGGGAVAEAAALGVPAVFVPYPHHADRQQARNAANLARRGGAVVVEEADLGPASFDGVVLPLLRDEAARGRMGAAALACGRPDAADRVARLVLERMGGVGAARAAGEEARTPAAVERANGGSHVLA
jgi:UDP-N-acetylglucosamine--N-acetylmuramyl-(pentapeptide) pyrophosphoryl-undecaprenol N-acetylglucosamine transferase